MSIIYEIAIVFMIFWFHVLGVEDLSELLNLKL